MSEIVTDEGYFRLLNMARSYKPEKRRYQRRESPEETFIATRMSQAKYRAEQKGLEFDLTVEFLKKLYDGQAGFCFYSGRPMKLEGGKRKMSAASIDRIDNTLGYTQENVVWCIAAVNVMKQHLEAGEFVDLCKDVANNV